LVAYTRGNAWSGFMEDRTGQLAPGFYADIAVFDRDLLTTDPLKVQDAKVLHTFVGGKQRYTAA
jgi:predicted amidohydrolase YtcJ